MRLVHALPIFFALVSSPLEATPVPPPAPAPAPTPVSQALTIRGVNLTLTDDFNYDTIAPSGPIVIKSGAQLAVDYIASIGGKHVVLHPEGHMTSATASAVDCPSLDHPETWPKEREGYLRLIKYIKSKGMTVGIRPMFFVDNETTSGGNIPGKASWHGNIQPANPQAWFDSFRKFLDHYAEVAEAGQAEEFTIGAELQSMTVGTPEWKEHPQGFGAEWKALARHMRDKLGPHVRLMYDSNYTDEAFNADGSGGVGGELEHWRHALVELKRNHATAQTWQDLRDFWMELDAVGVDMYRSLGSRGDHVPDDYPALVQYLSQRADEVATDLDNKFSDIEGAVGGSKHVILKEIGFKSCTACFIDPGVYDNPNLVTNLAHQAAAYQAAFNALVVPNWPWLDGLSLWDVSTSPYREGKTDPGFTPRGKPQTEAIIKSFWAPEAH